jgi:L-ascorbate metabolism protein UlaG (beta-lactamase superfamily)
MTARRALARLRNLDLPRGRLAFIHLGQLGFLVRLGRTVFGIDLFLSPMEGRLVPPLLAPEDVADAVDVLIGTHDHADHIDRPLWTRLAALGCRAKFILPEAVRAAVLAETGLRPSRVAGLTGGESRTVGGVKVAAVAAAHERLEKDANGCDKALWFVLSAHGVRLYHAGDCCPYEGLQTTLASFGRFDAAFLPINGRSAWRLSNGFIGCMDAHEAVELAGELDVKTLVPGHYDMFAPNLGDVEECRAFARVKYPELGVLVPKTGTVQIV